MDFLIEILNLPDSADQDIAYSYSSRLAREPAGGIDYVHLHSMERRGEGFHHIGTIGPRRPSFDGTTLEHGSY